MSGVAARDHLLLVNPSAGAGRSLELLGEASAALGHLGVKFRTVFSESLEHGRLLCTEAAAAGEAVVVMSGDGLIGQAGGVLAGSEAPLGIIPGGRGNDLARALGIPVSPAAAAELIAAGPTRRIDVGVAGSKRFLGIASCGLDSEVNRIANDSRLVKGKLVYTYATLVALARWQPARFELRLDGEPLHLDGHAVAVANSSSYGGGMRIAPRAELDDGAFDVVMTGNLSRLSCLANLPKVFGGRHVANPAVNVVRACSVELKADRPFELYADGDVITTLPATLSLLPRALRVIAP